MDALTLFHLAVETSERISGRTYAERLLPWGTLRGQSIGGACPRPALKSQLEIPAFIVSHKMDGAATTATRSQFP